MHGRRRSHVREWASLLEEGVSDEALESDGSGSDRDRSFDPDDRAR